MTTSGPLFAALGLLVFAVTLASVACPLLTYEI